jgi:hypothetical protein
MGRVKFYINEQGDYNALEVENHLERLKVIKPNPCLVHTVLSGKVISKVDVSERYQVFDFSKFVTDHLETIEKQFQPKSYELKIHKGYQEVRFLGEMQQINQEEYLPMFVIMNSSNCSYPLSVNFGMLRLVCSNGMVIGKEGEHFGFKVKHYRNAISNRIAGVENILENFQGIFERNRGLLEYFNDSEISYAAFLKKMILNPENIPIISQLKNAKLLGKKLLTSASDAIDHQELNSKQVKALENPGLLLIKDKSVADINLSKFKVFQCYTEIYRNYNSAIHSKETNKIFNILNTLN